MIFENVQQISKDLITVFKNHQELSENYFDNFRRFIYIEKENYRRYKLYFLMFKTVLWWY